MKIKSFIIIVTFALLVAGLSTAIGQDVSKIKFPALNPIPTPEIDTLTLDNGIKLYLLEDHSLPIFRVSLRVNGGTYLEPPHMIGLGDLCGTVMRTGGTSRWTGDEIDEILEGIGGSVSASVGLISSGGSVNMLAEYSDLGLEVLADVIRNPIFDQDKIDLAMVQFRSGISRRNDNVGGIASREFRKLIYGASSPYASEMEYATLDAISRDDLIGFHKLVFRPGNIQMAIWGEFDKTQVIAKITELFGDWQAEAIALPDPPAVNYDYRSKVYLVDKPDAKQAYIRVGHIGGKVSDTDYASRIVMNSILGGSFGSRLMDNVRTRLGLAYSTFGRYGANNSFQGMFFAHASTGNENVMKATKEMFTQINSMLTDQPTVDEMKKGKDGYLNSFVFNFDSKGEVINRLMGYDFYDIPRDFLQTTKKTIEEMTPEKVMAAAQSAIKPDQMIVLIVGDVTKFDEPVTALGLGEPEILDITIPTAAPELDFVITDSTLSEGKALLEMMIAAHGGKNAIAAITSTKITGTMTYMMPQGNFPIKFDETIQLPYYVSATMNVMGRSFINITGPNGAWATGPDGILADKSEVELENEKPERDRNLINLLQMASDSPYQPVYAGSGVMDKQNYETLVIIDKEEKHLCVLKLDAESFVLLSKSYDGKTMLGEGAVEDFYMDLQTKNNVLLPMKSIKNLNGDMVAEVIYETYEINPEIPSGVFEKP